MEAKGRTARLLVRRLIGASSEGDDAAADAAISEIRLLSKHDPEFRPLLVDAGAVPLLAHHLLLFYDNPDHPHSPSSQEDAAAALLNLSLPSREPLMATPGLLDGLAATLRRPASPAAAQHAAAALYSLLSVDAYRPIIGAKDDILSALVAMLRPSAPPRHSPTGSIKDALKALFAVALYPLNRASLVRLGAVPALFSLVVKDGRAGVVEDCTAVVAQVAGCEESVEAFRRVSGVQILVDLVDAATGASERTRENAAAALLNLALSGGEKAQEDIREVETAIPVVRELAEAGTTPRAKRKAGPLLDILVDHRTIREISGMTTETLCPATEKTPGRIIRRPSAEVAAPLLPRECSDASAAGDASFVGAVFNLSTNIVGAGIMALPACARVLGVVPTVVLILLVAFLTDAAIELLLRFSRAGKASSYAGVMGDAFGWGGRVLLQVAVVLKIVGILIVYMIIVGDVLSGTSSSGVHHSGVLEGWFGAHWWTGRFFVLLIATLVVFLPLTCFKRIDSLRYTSALSVTLAVVFVVITVGIVIIKLLNGSISVVKLFPDVKDLASFWNLFTVVPVMVTAYICHYNVHTIKNELADSTQMRPVVQTSLALCTTIYITTSLFGFLLFGEDTLDDVLANFDSNLGIPYSSLVNDIVRVSYAVHLVLVFPIVFFALRLNMDGLLFPSARPLSSDNRRFGLLTVLLVALVFSGANFIPNIWDAFQLTGATSAVCIGFIFPASISLRDPHGIATRRDKVLSILMIVLAVFSSAVAVYSDVYSIFHKSKR